MRLGSRMGNGEHPNRRRLPVHTSPCAFLQPHRARGGFRNGRSHPDREILAFDGSHGLAPIASILRTRKRENPMVRRDLSTLPRNPSMGYPSTQSGHLMRRGGYRTASSHGIVRADPDENHAKEKSKKTNEKIQEKKVLKTAPGQMLLLDRSDFTIQRTVRPKP